MRTRDLKRKLDARRSELIEVMRKCQTELDIIDKLAGDVAKAAIPNKRRSRAAGNGAVVQPDPVATA